MRKGQELDKKVEDPKKTDKCVELVGLFEEENKEEEREECRRRVKMKR